MELGAFIIFQTNIIFMKTTKHLLINKKFVYLGTNMLLKNKRNWYL